MSDYYDQIAKYKKVFWGAGVPWEAYKGFLQPEVPPNIEISLTEEEGKKLLVSAGVRLIRWSTDFDVKKELPWWYVIKEGPCSLQELSAKTRNQVKKALKSYEVKKVCASYIMQHGYNVYMKAFSRYKGCQSDSVRVNEEAFKKNVGYDEDFPDLIHYFGVFYEGQLVAYAKNYVCEDVVLYVVIKSIPEYLEQYSNYALLFEMNNYYLNGKKVKYVCDGARSIWHKTDIQNFLIAKFKFRRAYCRLNVIYAKTFGAIVRLLYPLRKVFYLGRDMLKSAVLAKISVILLQEEIRRQCVGSTK